MSSLCFRSHGTTSTQPCKVESGEKPRGCVFDGGRNRVPLELQSRSGSERMWSNKLEEAPGHAQQRPPLASFPKRLTSVLNHST